MWPRRLAERISHAVARRKACCDRARARAACRTTLFRGCDHQRAAHGEPRAGARERAMRWNDASRGSSPRTWWCTWSREPGSTSLCSRPSRNCSAQAASPFTNSPCNSLKGTCSSSCILKSTSTRVCARRTGEPPSSKKKFGRSPSRERACQHPYRAARHAHCRRGGNAELSQDVEDFLNCFQPSITAWRIATRCMCAGGAQDFRFLPLRDGG